MAQSQSVSGDGGPHPLNPLQSVVMGCREVTLLSKWTILSDTRQETPSVLQTKASERRSVAASEAFVSCDARFR